ncbi:Uncharacterised protein [Chryseobacterium nakagawai]|uniref:hypothetical protein n=1 Tax=Chryseobacterium nakagawai TaxID=1241982 RepID=UPI000F4DAE9E|nr:hypothetical protein [Chryseobacterium nakagawai]VEH18553.1 Uncharacterised protein [Chryseobacterium nakagawai]
MMIFNTYGVSKKYLINFLTKIKIHLLMVVVSEVSFSHVGINNARTPYMGTMNVPYLGESGGTYPTQSIGP